MTGILIHWVIIITIILNKNEKDAIRFKVIKEIENVCSVNDHFYDNQPKKQNRKRSRMQMNDDMTTTDDESVPNRKKRKEIE